MFETGLEITEKAGNPHAKVWKTIAQDRKLEDSLALGKQNIKKQELA